MKCTACGKDVSEQTKFCPNCGRKIETVGIIKKHAPGTIIGEIQERRINVLCAQRLKQEIFDIIPASKPSIVLDMKNVEMIDSTGIGIIMGIFSYLKNNEGRIALCGLSEMVKKIFDASGASRLIPIYENENAAVSSVVLSRNSGDDVKLNWGRPT